MLGVLLYFIAWLYLDSFRFVVISVSKHSRTVSNFYCMFIYFQYIFETMQDSCLSFQFTYELLSVLLFISLISLICQLRYWYVVFSNWRYSCSLHNCTYQVSKSIVDTCEFSLIHHYKSYSFVIFFEKMP